jgi:hypothetical protein
VGIAMLASGMAMLVATPTPAGAAAPQVDLFSSLYLTNTAQNGTQGEVPNKIAVVAVIRHDPGTTVNGVRFDLVHATSGGTYGSTNCATTASITCSGGYVGNGGWNNVGGRATNTSLVVRELPGQASATTSTNSNYSLVIVNVTPPNFDSWQNDGPDGSNNGICGIEGGTRLCKNTASFSFRLSDGQTTADQSYAYFTTAESQSSGTEDYPASYTSAGTTGNSGGLIAPATVSAGSNGAVTISYTCDDNDSSGPNNCDSAKLRYRRVGDNAFVNPGASSDSAGYLQCSLAVTSPGCETRSTTPPVAGNFNADDNSSRTYTYRAPRSRGLYVIEANWCNENGQCPGGSGGGRPADYDDSSTVGGLTGGGAWQTLGAFYVNDAAPTVSFGTTTQTGGSTVGTHPTTGALRPRTGTTLTFNATTSADAQVLDWNLDQNSTNGINGSGYEQRSYGTVSYASSPGTPTLAKTATLDLASYGSGVSCAVGVRVYDTGGLNAADPSSASATATRSCTTNNIPAGTAQSGLTVQRGTGLAIDLAVTDADRWAGGSGGDESPTVSITQPAAGSVTCGAFVVITTTTGRFPCTYTVPPNTTPGAFSFGYTVTDSFDGTSSAASVAGTIANTAPTATGSTRTIERGGDQTFNLAGTDPVNSDTIDGSIANTGYEVVSEAGLPAGSTLDCSASGACTVSIAPDTPTGAYSFTWTVRDDAATSSAATETITVSNTAPVADPLVVNGVQRGRPAAESSFQLSASDANDGDTITFEVVDTDDLPVGTVVDCDSAGACTISVPADTPLGDYPFTFRALNPVGSLNTTSADATVTIGVGNTAPVANPVGPMHTTVGADLDVQLDGADLNGDTLTYDAPIDAPTKGTLTGAGDLRTYVAADGTKGTDTFTYTVSDNGPATSAPGTVTIEIDNSAPTADAGAVDAPRRVPTAIVLTGTDPNADDLTFAVQDTADKGVLDCAPDGTCTYTSNPGETGTDTFTFLANDGTANSAPATITITLTNSAPTADDQAVDAPRRVPTAIVLTGTDPNEDDLAYAIDTQPTKGTLDCAPDGTCTYTSNPGETGTDTFTFLTDDGTANSAPATITITLTNSAPTANGASYTVTKGIAKSFTLAGTDPNGDPLTYTLQDLPINGTVGCIGAVCTYTASVTTGADQLTFTAEDSEGAVSDVATVFFGIAPVRVSVDDATVLEPDPSVGQTGVVVPLTLSGRLATDVTVSYYTENITATAGADYLQWGTPAKPRTVKIAAGNSWMTISPPIKPDGVTEADESFRLVIASVVTTDGTPVDIGVGAAEVTIIDSYDPADGPIVWVHDTDAAETDNLDGQKAQFSIQLTHSLTQPLVVDLLLTPTTATEGPAASGGDFRRPAAKSLTIAPGDSRKVYDLVVWGDTVTEGDEEMVLTLVFPDGSPVVQGRTSGILTIVDDD